MWAFDWYQNRWPWMTLNGVMAVILRYFTEFGSFRGPITSQWLTVTHSLTFLAGFIRIFDIRRRSDIADIRYHTIVWMVHNERCTIRYGAPYRMHRIRYGAEYPLPVMFLAKTDPRSSRTVSMPQLSFFSEDMIRPLHLQLFATRRRFGVFFVRFESVQIQSLTHSLTYLLTCLLNNIKSQGCICQIFTGGVRVSTGD